MHSKKAKRRRRRRRRRQPTTPRHLAERIDLGTAEHPSRRVYIQLRHWNSVKRRTENCTGYNIRCVDFRPDEVHRIIVDALRRAADEYQRQAREKEPPADES